MEIVQILSRFTLFRYLDEIGDICHSFSSSLMKGNSVPAKKDKIIDDFYSISLQFFFRDLVNVSIFEK